MPGMSYCLLLSATPYVVALTLAMAASGNHRLASVHTHLNWWIGCRSAIGSVLLCGLTLARRSLAWIHVVMANIDVWAMMMLGIALATPRFRRHSAGAAGAVAWLLP